MSKSKSGQNAKRILERLRSNEPASGIAADLGVRDSEVVAARDLVRHIGEHQAVAAGQLPEALAQGVVEAAVQIEHADFLKAVAEGGGKGAASAAKRGLAILRSKGIEVEVAPASEPVFKAEPEHAEELPSFVSTADSSGERALWIPRAVRGGLQLVTALFSDTEGIVRVATDEVSRKGFRRLREDLLGHARPLSIGVFEVSTARALGYLAAARALNPRGLTIDQEAQLSGLLVGDPEDAVSPERRAPALPEALEAQRLAESASLHEERELRSWIPDPDRVRSLALKLDEIGTSALYLDEAQKRAQSDAELRRGLGEYFDAARRERYAHRLFDVAEAFRGSGHAEAADRAAAVARALLAGRDPGEIPFCRRMMEKLLARAAKQAAAVDPAPQGLIVPP